MLKTIKAITIFTFSNVTCLISLAVLFFIFDFDAISSLVLTLILGSFLFSRTTNQRRRTNGKKRKDPRSNNLTRVSPEKEAFYREMGLTKEEMNLFRSTMHTAREQIYAVEANSKQRNKLKAIITRNNTIAILKDFFRHIVEQPQRLHEVNKFLYTHLPNLKELTEQYLEIDQHVAKSKETYQALDKCAETIDDMCILIKDDYLAFMANDIDNMDVEIELANHVINSHNGENKTVLEPSENEI
ncbi:5-bromo-4-chloroindolyl phosphate hydrolysis family protein [Jeotgalibaca caeni]|uniref:5-bromo-4-chloroindolyl phosphate hydrolysis family protein n=1 Tax=Jeotgalibaca caeni TaxID=3028623 RepID=UPI00237DBB82|nr:5-bromo-4-chloroindolyl phosphate hydrolysis family protein [Jeotgalibaca caeni]MDE1547921.1 5-bromo-4-chloroindolyl phosphate hydrolysis family protein [Jeotgalibaca caeni]